MDQKQFVLVHGACHGAWCWHKLKPRLESAGHKVTILDLAASGINRKAIQDLHGIVDYSEPLLEFLASLPSNEKVVLAGHSLGGLNLALAMEKFPEKVALGVFLTAFMPDIEHKPSYVINEFIKRIPIDGWLDAQFSSSGSLTTMSFGPKFLSTKLYQLCSIEDLELAKVLVRPGLLFTEDLSKAKNFTKEGYGSVPRVYIVAKEDECITEEYQLWVIQNGGVQEVLEIKGADHMAMLSKPQQLCTSLIEIGNKYA